MYVNISIQYHYYSFNQKKNIDACQYISYILGWTIDQFWHIVYIYRVGKILIWIYILYITKNIEMLSIAIRVPGFRQHSTVHAALWHSDVRLSYGSESRRWNL